jgi:DNA-binding transcriptional ArsR family regulator
MTRIDQRRLAERARVLKALAHPTRLFIVEELAAGELCVCQIVRKSKAGFSTVSKHLSILKEAGIVEDDKRGLQVFYHLRAPCVLRFMTCIEAVIERRVRAEAALVA